MATALGLGGAHVAVVLLMGLDAPAFDPSLRYAAGWLLGGLLPSVAVAALLPSRWAGGRLLRGGALLYLLALLGTWAYSVWLSGRYAFEAEGTLWLVGTDALALGFAGWLLRRAGGTYPVSPRFGDRLALVLATAAIALLWGSPTLREVAEEHREQRLSPLSLELVAAYDMEPPGELAEGEMRSVVVDAQGQIGPIVRLGGRRYNLHRGDSLAAPPGSLRRVRWHDPGGEGAILTLRFDPAFTRALEERARRRSSQLDVLLVEGEPALLVLHGSASGLLILGDADRRRLYRLYRRLAPE